MPSVWLRAAYSCRTRELYLQLPACAAYMHDMTGRCDENNVVIILPSLFIAMAANVLVALVLFLDVGVLCIRMPVVGGFAGNNGLL